LILAGLAMLGPFSINAYLPSFHEMSVVLHTDRVALQQTISGYFGAVAFMSLWHGAISDSLDEQRWYCARAAGLLGRRRHRDRARCGVRGSLRGALIREQDADHRRRPWRFPR
jgi:hypothetical protein